MQQRSANDDALMTELLELAGWKIQRRDNGESLYIPGWSVASKAGYDWNLCDYTEGYDFFVLQGLDFKVFLPKIIITEDEKPPFANQGEKHALLQSRGYRLHCHFQSNAIWVLESK